MPRPRRYFIASRVVVAQNECKPAMARRYMGKMVSMSKAPDRLCLEPPPPTPPPHFLAITSACNDLEWGMGAGAQQKSGGFKPNFQHNFLNAAAASTRPHSPEIIQALIDYKLVVRHPAARVAVLQWMPVHLRTCVAIANRNGLLYARRMSPYHMQLPERVRAFARSHTVTK